MAGKERGNKIREDSEEPGTGKVADSDAVAQAASEDTEDVSDGEPGRRIPGINGYDPNQWPDARP